MSADTNQPTGKSDDEQSAFSRVTVTRPQFGQPVSIPRLELSVEREDGRADGRVVVADGELCRIGPHPSNDLVLQDPAVSRFHCRLSRGPDAWRVSDTGSLNGTSVGGVRVREADLPLPECRLALGSSIVRVRELGSTATDAVPVWPSFGMVAGTSLVMRRLFGTLARVARSDSTLLIEGESGTGKEIIATELVRLGARAGKPLMVVDCGAISPSSACGQARPRRRHRRMGSCVRLTVELGQACDRSSCGRGCERATRAVCSDHSAASCPCPSRSSHSG